MKHAKIEEFSMFEHIQQFSHLQIYLIWCDYEDCSKESDLFNKVIFALLHRVKEEFSTAHHHSVKTV